MEQVHPVIKSKGPMGPYIGAEKNINTLRSCVGCYLRQRYAFCGGGITDKHPHQTIRLTDGVGSGLQLKGTQARCIANSPIPIETPAMIAALQLILIDFTQRQVHTAMRTPVFEHAQSAVLPAVENNLLAKQLSSLNLSRRYSFGAQQDHPYIDRIGDIAKPSWQQEWSSTP